MDRQNMRKVDFLFHIGMFVILSITLSLSDQWIGIILIVQFVVGVFQVFSTLARMINYQRFDAISQSLLKIYWISVLLYMIGLALVYTLKEVLFLPYLLSAWIIALYYCCITYRLAYSTPGNKNQQ